MDSSSRVNGKEAVAYLSSYFPCGEEPCRGNRQLILQSPPSTRTTTLHYVANHQADIVSDPDAFA
jgi:hypothetical protein